MPGVTGFFRGLPLPGPRERLVLLVLLLMTGIAVGTSAWYASNRTPPTYTPAPKDVGAQAEPTAGAPAPTAVRSPVLAFYGDWFVSGTTRGGSGAAGWPAIVSRRIGADGTVPHAATDAGYVRPSSTTADTFDTLAQKAPEPNADVTIVFGGRNDYRATPPEIAAAARRTFATIRAAAPQTRLLVIGPAWTNPEVPAALPPIRDAVQQAATASGATFVDPLADRWLFDNPELLSADGISLTDAGHVYLADHIEPVVDQLLSEVPGISFAGAAAPIP